LNPDLNPEIFWCIPLLTIPPAFRTLPRKSRTGIKSPCQDHVGKTQQRGAKKKPFCVETSWKRPGLLTELKPDRAPRRSVEQLKHGENNSTRIIHTHWNVKNDNAEEQIKAECSEHRHLVEHVGCTKNTCQMEYKNLWRNHCVLTNESQSQALRSPTSKIIVKYKYKTALSNEYLRAYSRASPFSVPCRLEPGPSSGDPYVSPQNPRSKSIRNVRWFVEETTAVGAASTLWNNIVLKAEEKLWDKTTSAAGFEYSENGRPHPCVSSRREMSFIWEQLDQ